MPHWLTAVVFSSTCSWVRFGSPSKVLPAKAAQNVDPSELLCGLGRDGFHILPFGYVHGLIEPCHAACCRDLIHNLLCLHRVEIRDDNLGTLGSVQLCRCLSHSGSAACNDCDLVF